MHDPPPCSGPAQPTDDGLIEIVAELSFDAPVAPAELSAIARSCAWCLETHRVKFVRLYLARNRKRAILLLRAPDAESVRLAYRHAAMRFERVWPCGQTRGGLASLEPPP
jgi:hypothetical protein